MALGVNPGNKFFSPKRIQFASQRTNFFTIPSGCYKRGPVERNLALGEDPANRIIAPANLQEAFAFCGI